MCQLIILDYILVFAATISYLYSNGRQREVEYQINSFLYVFLVSFCSFYSCFIIFFVAFVGNVSSNKIDVPIRFLKDKS